MIDVSAHPRGSVLCVRAQPGAKRNALIGECAGALRVAVTAAPERGKANEAIVEVLADALGCKRSQLILIAGETSRDKRFLLEGVSPQELLDRISTALRP